MSNQTYCCTTPGALCFSAAVFAVLYGLGLLLPVFWPGLGAYQNVILLSALGLTCVTNFAKNRTVHCGLTGPLFLIAAAVLALGTAGILNVPQSIVWPFVLIGVGISFFVEWRVTQPARG